jgi:hypothetical protein
MSSENRRNWGRGVGEYRLACGKTRTDSLWARRHDGRRYSTKCSLRYWKGQRRKQWWIKWHIRKQRSGRIGTGLETVAKKIKITNILCNINLLEVQCSEIDSPVLYTMEMFYFIWIVLYAAFYLSFSKLLVTRPELPVHTVHRPKITMPKIPARKLQISSRCTL